MHSLRASYFIFFALIGIFVPYFNLYCHELGFTSIQIGIFLAFYSLMKCFSPLLWGTWADRSRRRKELLILAGWGAALVFMGFFATRTFWPMVALITFYGFFRAPLIPMVEATTWEHLPFHGWEYGRIRLWGSIGFITATLGAGILTGYFSISIILYLMLALLITQVLFFGHLPAQRASGHETAASIGGLLTNKPLLLFLLIGFLVQVSHGIYYGFFSIHMHDHGYGENVIGLNWTASILCEVILMRNYKKWLGQYTPITVITVSALLACIRWFALGFTTHLPAMLLVQCLHAFTFGATHIASLMYVDRNTAHTHKTRGQGLYSAVTFGMGIMTGSALGGVLYDRVGGFEMFIWAGWISVLALLLTLLHRARFATRTAAAER